MQLRSTLNSQLSGARYETFQLKENRNHLLQLIEQKQRRITHLDSLLRQKREQQKVSYSAPVLQASEPVLSDETVSTLPLSVVNGTRGKKLISLTFDGGSVNNAAAQILDTLADRDVRATMFLTGHFIRRYPRTVKDILAAGHEVGNHTWSHPHLTTWAQNRRHHTLPEISREMIGSQLLRANDQFRSITGQDLAPIWRAPFGEKNKQICSWALSYGYVHIAWKQGRTWRENYDSNDWVPDEDTPGYRTPEEVLEKYLHLARQEQNGMNGGILLFHLGTARKDPDQQVHLILGSLIDSFHSMGYQIVPVTVLLQESGIDIRALMNESKMVVQH
ncbi:MAG: polysaccharide deacetylase family protein [Chitinivibrionales bacterium]